MPERSFSYRDLLGVRGLPALLGAATLARLADRMLSLAIVLYVLARFGSPTLAGWLTFAVIAPGLLVSPLAGAILDRLGSVRAVALDMAVSSALILVLVLAGRSGRATPATLFVLVGLFSLTSPLSVAGIRTLLPRSVPKSALDRVNALDTATHALADVLGPVLAGLLVAFAGAAPALTVIASTYGAAAMSIAFVRRVQEPFASRDTLFSQTIDGIRAVICQSALRGLAVSYALYQITWGMLVIAVPVAATRMFPANTGESVTGLLWAVAGIMGGAGAVVAGRLRTAGRERQVMAGGMLATALAVWPVAATSGLTGLALGLTIAGLAGGPIDVGLLTMRQRLTDPAALGRVLAVSISLNISGFPIGSALAGMLITYSLPVAFIVAGLASILAAITVWIIPKDIEPNAVA